MEADQSLSLDLSHATPELFAALAKAQGEIEDASKNKKNDHLKSRYADLAEMLGEIRPTFSKNGLALSQWPTRGLDSSVIVTTIVSHATGGYIRSDLSMMPVQAGPQAVGSAITYARKYAAAAAAGIAQEDDDGEAAMPPQRSAAQQRAVEDAEQRRSGPRPPQRRQPDQQRAAPQDQQQAVDDTAPASPGPFAADLTPGQIAMVTAKAGAVGVDDAGMVELFGMVSAANINTVLTTLRSMADKAPE